MNRGSLALLGRILDELGMSPEQAIQYLATNHGVSVGAERPDLPDTMFGLTCQVDRNDEIAFGDVYSATGFSKDSELMTIMVTKPDRPMGGVAITKDQARQLRDWLSSKVDE